VVSGVAPAAGVTATSTPASNRLALYDSNNATIWNENLVGTGPKGIVWFADVLLATTSSTLVDITLTPPSHSPIPKLTVENQAITFVTQDVD
jgi:hypothetical protein